MSDPTPSRPLGRRLLRWLRRQIEHCLAVIGLGTIVYCSCFNLSRVYSDSMAPTLRGQDWRTGDLVLTERVSYRFRQPRRWAVMTFRTSNEGNQIMKRVVGLPGERIQILRGGKILIDGEPIELPAELAFLKYLPYGNVIEGKTVECGDGYYVLGDDSRDSDDSRFNGPVQPDQVIGRAWLILAPQEHRGWVKR